MDGTSDILPRFAPGERRTLGGDRPFLLDGEDVWLVTGAPVDVFAVRLRAGEPIGFRTHLLRIAPGGAAFGRPRGADGWGLLAVGRSEGGVIRIGREAFALDRDGLALVARWVDGLHAAMAHERFPTASIELPAGVETEVAGGQNVRIREELGWIAHLSGSSTLLGCAGLELDGDAVPVTRHAWFHTAGPCRLLAAPADPGDDPDRMWRGLDRLHDHVSRWVESSTRAGDGAALDRMRQRGAFQRGLLHETCEHLAATMEPGAPAHRVADPADRGLGVHGADDPLLAACRLVGGALGLAMKPAPARGDDAPSRNPLGDLLRASRVRARQVALRASWWREDSGPLLGFRGPERRPVALLRDGASGPYELHDPASRERVRVDAAVAETLEPFAHGLYRPFPDAALRIRDVLRFAMRGSRRDLVVVLAMVSCAAVLGMVPAIATGVLFNTVIPGAQRAQLIQMTFVLLACAGVTALFQVAQSVALLRIETRAGAALQAAVWDRLLCVPLPFFRAYTAGDLASRAMAVDGIRQVVSGSTVTAVVGAVVGLGNYALMFWYSRAMALWATLILAVVLATSLGGSLLQLRPQRGIAASQSKLLGLVLQLLSSVAKLRVAGAEVPAFALWVRQFGVQRRLQYRARLVSNWLASLHATIPLLASLVLFAVALPLVLETRELQTGDFMAFLTAFTACSGAILSSTPALVAILNTLPLFEQARPILEALPEVDVDRSDPGQLAGDIEIQHATFRYQADGPLVLRDVSVRIRAGEFVAFVGPSGSGKSTLLRMLLGFEKLEGGAIYYDGQELGGLDVQAVRRQMGVVLQSGRLLSGDIFSNIVGSSAASLDEAWTAARMAGLAEDIEAMPMGMHTVISEGGGTLSGGQRQRLLIARAIVGRPRILLFDEATSALDNRTQAIVSASLETLQATRIVVAHRLSTIVNADRIYVMERGQVVQTGTYAELMARSGPFAELARRQLA